MHSEAMQCEVFSCTCFIISKFLSEVQRSGSNQRKGTSESVTSDSEYGKKRQYENYYFNMYSPEDEYPEDTVMSRA
jgi:hypothetical protein